ncbi:unnamed protein product [Heterobilharzia americana]|nr:unnamed protein product [Heterobilharzia americana]
MCKKYSSVKLNCKQLKTIKHFTVHQKYTEKFRHFSQTIKSLPSLSEQRQSNITPVKAKEINILSKICYLLNAKFMQPKFYRFYKTTYTPSLFLYLCVIIMIIFLPVSLSYSVPASPTSLSLTSARTSSYKFVSKRQQFMNLKLLRHMGEKILRSGGVVTQLFDAIEFSVVHERSIPYLNIQYFIGYNRSLWLTLTPCTNVLNRVEFSASSTYNAPWEESKTHALRVTKSEMYRSNWPFQKVCIELFPGEKYPPKYTLTNHNDTILHSQRSRIHYAQNKYNADSLNIRLYGGSLGDAYNVRLSTRCSPGHAYDGYPMLDKSPNISVCLIENTNDTLDISWNQVENGGMQINYCVVVNADENLYYRCTAMARLNQSSNYETKEKLKRPKVFRDTDHFRPELIDNYVYKCTNKSITRIRLSPVLTRVLNQLSMNNSLKLFINIYAVNKLVDVSSAYPVKIIQHYIEKCETRRHVNDIQVSYEPYIFKLLWNSDVSFQWKSSRKTVQLYYQPCNLPMDKSINYTISLIRQSFSENVSESPEMKKLCEYSIINHHVLQMCLNSSTDGVYFLQLNGDVKFKNGVPVGRYFFLTSNATNLLPKKPKHTDYPTDIFSITIQPSSSQTIFQIPPFILHNSRHYHFTAKHRVKRNNHGYYSRQMRSRQKLTKRLSNFMSTKINRYLMKSSIPSVLLNHHHHHHHRHYVSKHMENIPNFLKRRSLRNSMKNGFHIGVDCTLHQLYISLTIHINPQNYWIYTLPLACHLTNNLTFLWIYINNMEPLRH